MIKAAHELQPGDRVLQQNARLAATGPEPVTHEMLVTHVEPAEDETTDDGIVVPMVNLVREWGGIYFDEIVPGVTLYTMAEPGPGSEENRP